MKIVMLEAETVTMLMVEGMVEKMSVADSCKKTLIVECCSCGVKKFFLSHTL